MVILDSNSGKAVATLPIGWGFDATAFDAESSIAYASNGDGASAATT